MPIFTSSIELSDDYPSIQPSLNLNFARARALDPRITFTRASVGTYVGRDGLIKTAGENEARFDHDPDTLESLGLLIEESRTNEVLNSSLFNESAGQPNFNQSFAVQQASEVGPDGETGGVSLFHPNSIDTTHYYYASYLSQTGDHSISAWFKNLTTTIYYPQLRVFNIGGGQAFATFDITGDGAVYSSGGNAFTSASIEKYPNGWYRCEMRCTDVNVHSMGIVISNSTSAELPGYAGSVDSNKGFLVWGVQVENNSFPTSYIPTSGAAATRAVDVANITGDSFSSFNNHEENSLLVHCILDKNTNLISPIAKNQVSFRDNNGANGYEIRVVTDLTSPSIDSHGNYDGAVNFDAAGISLSDGVNEYKIAMGFALNNHAFVTGSTVQGDNTVATSTTQTQLSIGLSPTKVHYKNIVYYPKRLTNAQLQLLTS